MKNENKIARACVDKTKCIACGACWAVCPVNAIQQGPDSLSQVNKDCIACGACVGVCPTNCIKIKMTSKDIDWS